MEIHLVKGELDFCLSSPPIRGHEIECDIVLTENIYIIVPKTHQFANKNDISWTDLNKERFVSLKKGYGIRDLTDHYCEMAGFTPNITYEGNEPATLVALVQADLGISFVPESAIRSSLAADMTFLQLKNRKCKREIGLSHHKNRYFSNAAQKFRQVIKNISA
jgi:DNA-binding transcriptional LysR family regulator